MTKEKPHVWQQCLCPTCTALRAAAEATGKAPKKVKPKPDSKKKATDRETAP